MSKKSLAAVLASSLLVMSLFQGCGQPNDTDPAPDDNVFTTETTYTTTAETTTATTKTTAAKTTAATTTAEATATTTVQTVATAAPAVTAGADDAAAPAELEVPVNNNNYAPMIPKNAGYGIAPGVLEKRLAPGMPDVVAVLLAEMVDYSRMNFYIGVVDLLDPNGYRHIDDSGEIHPSSVIKAWIAEYAYLQVAAGNARLTDIVSGSTLLYHIKMMMQDSCNSSTARVITYFGRSNIDNWLNENYTHVRLHADLRGNYSEGRTNTASVADSIALLEKIWHNQHDGIYGPILEIMFGTRMRAKLPSLLEPYERARVACKTGSYIYFNAADHDIGIIVEYDEFWNITLAYAVAVYTFSPAHKPTFSWARQTIFNVVHTLHYQFQYHYYYIKPNMPEPEPPATEPPATEPPTTEPPPDDTPPPTETPPPEPITE